MTVQPTLKQLEHENAQLRSELRSYRRFVPPGHFYSPIPAIEEIRAEESRIFQPPPRTLPGIDFREDRQIALVQAFRTYYEQIPFPDRKQQGLRFYYDNPAYSYGDAVILYCMIRHCRPKRIVEIGSGYSSCVMLDTNQLFLNNSVQCTFVDPDPQLLLGLINPEDHQRVRVIPQRLQTLDVRLFESLTSGDILLVDSTHVGKIDSDVNHIFFNILPRLQSGVYVHFHDVFHPFEYPSEWIYEGRAWNEAYMLRAFLQFNRSFQIEYFATFMYWFHRGLLAEALPLCLKNIGGNIWLRRV